jgi:hypothetical protein
MGWIARCVGLGGWLVCTTAAAEGSASQAVLNGEISWVTTEGVVPRAVPHELRVHGDMVVPLPLADAEPTPAMASGGRAATLYMAMDGITLQPTCPTGDYAHSAFDCTGMVSEPATLPAVTSVSEQSTLYQGVRSQLAPFDIYVTTSRPPAYLPYFVAAIGGNSDWTGRNVCGLGTLGCAGIRRNLVSVNFPGTQNCSDIASTVAHEFGHNIGLEHTSLPPDLMYPTNGADRSAQDSCSDIVPHGNNTAPVCPSSHAQQCPAGEGNAQNTYAELMSRTGPRRHDATPPAILDLWPHDGGVFTTEDYIVVTAHIEDEGGTVGVRWRWLEGLPPGYDSFEQCTNDACELAFPLAAHASGQWDFVKLDRPPVGDYVFSLEAVDAYGNQVTESIHIRVDEPVEELDEEDTGEIFEETDGSGGELDLDDEDALLEDDDALPSRYGHGLDGEVGCGCRGGSPSPGPLLLLPWIVGYIRRSRSRG